jgi:hypothetical protein
MSGNRTSENSGNPLSDIQPRPLTRSQKPDTLAKTRISAAC